MNGRFLNYGSRTFTTARSILLLPHEIRPGAHTNAKVKVSQGSDPFFRAVPFECGGEGQRAGSEVSLREDVMCNRWNMGVIQWDA